ncbi:MAG TPA: TadE/TadG family type IV pilus assembly protein [Candidatus Binatia bacterium]|nr:TadE/TadG family type IV pilus assembly protein [Candidatus Binatia bacterium]
MRPFAHLDRSAGGRRRRSRGQALVEYAIIVPAFMLLLMGMLEFGFVFNHNLNLEYATREGARTGAALANGGTSNCPTVPSTSDGIDPNVTNPDIDAYIIAAVQRVLTSPGSPIDITQVSQIQIWKNDPANPGQPISNEINTWTNTGVGSGLTVDTQKLDFTETSTRQWHICERNNSTVPPDSIGVSIKYTYKMVTPLAAVLKFFGPGGVASLPMGDQTVMALNPTN